VAKKRLIWQLYPSYLIITILALVLVSWYSTRSLKTFYYAGVETDLKAKAQLACRQISPALSSQDYQEVDRLCKQLGQSAGVRFTVILPMGQVIGDSDKEPSQMENHADRPEFVHAMTGNIGTSIRFSDTLGKNMMYVAVPLKEQDHTLAVVRGSLPVTAVDQVLSNTYFKIAWAGIVVAILSAGITLVVSRRITRPIEQMREAARQFAAGSLDRRVPVPNSAELAELADSLNETAAKLQQTIDTITSERNRLEAVLASMAEGVIAVDPAGQVVSVNKAAAVTLGIDIDSAVGRSFEQAIQNAEVQRFIKQTLNMSSPVETDINLSPDSTGAFSAKSQQPVPLHLHGAQLAEKRGGKSGAVIVLRDMSQIQRLENIRRDFVANVSHEIRTPVTSIKGFVETLLDGAINEPQQAQRFLQIISGHTDRLIAIIDDLLMLSRLEEDGQVKTIAMEAAKVRPILESVIELSTPKAGDKKIKIDLDCKDAIEARMNPTLLEQAVFNLVDNAIKYSAPESTVQIIAQKTDNEVKIAVKDYGCGIEKDHLSRIFERFYVVDKARTRKLGGTGLGLSIVKHIIQLHGGSVTVESTPGQGSTFTLHLPVK
jgi:two-component system phosphate regulon sensor histidine kinase PhoR